MWVGMVWILKVMVWGGFCIVIGVGRRVRMKGERLVALRV